LAGWVYGRRCRDGTLYTGVTADPPNRSRASRARVPRRRVRWQRALFELHHQLRTEGGTPVRSGVAVGLGVFLGCFPAYGAHLVVVAVLARVLRLSRLRMYLAAHVSNPVTVGPLTVFELGVGRWWSTGTWPSLSLAELGQHGMLALGRDLLIGCVLVGTVAGTVCGAAAWAIGLRWRRHGFEDVLREEIGRRFTRTGVFDWEFARAKLRRDPIHIRLLAPDAVADGGRLLDLGCGRGLLLAAVAVAGGLVRQERWPADRPPPPRPDDLLGIDVQRRRVRTAQRAIAGEGAARVADLRTCRVPPFRTAVLVDVLHDLRDEDQDDLVARLASRIEPEGRVVLREVDAGGGLRARIARASEHVAAMFRGEWLPRMRFRTDDGWRRLFASHGLECETIEGARSGEILLVARPVGRAPHEPGSPKR